ncbi:unnamed protein product, partial [Mycena citricolor]
KTARAAYIADRRRTCAMHIYQFNHARATLSQIWSLMCPAVPPVLCSADSGIHPASMIPSETTFSDSVMGCNIVHPSSYLV